MFLPSEYWIWICLVLSTQLSLSFVSLSLSSHPLPPILMVQPCTGCTTQPEFPRIQDLRYIWNNWTMIGGRYSAQAEANVLNPRTRPKIASYSWVAQCSHHVTWHHFTHLKMICSMWLQIICFYSQILIHSEELCPMIFCWMQSVKCKVECTCTSKMWAKNNHFYTGIGLWTSPGTFTGTHRLIHGNTCLYRSPIRRFLVLKTPADPDVDG